MNCHELNAQVKTSQKKSPVLKWWMEPVD